MKKIIIILITTLISTTAFCQDIMGKLWEIKSSKVVLNGDTIVLFNKNDTIAYPYQLSKISYQFENNNEYTGTSIDSSIYHGKWEMAGDKIMIDGVQSNFQLISPSQFVISSTFILLDTSGKKAPALSLLEFTSKHNNESDISVYPIPFTEHLNIRANSSELSECNVYIRSYLGQLVYSNSLNFSQNSDVSLELNNLSPGIYFLTISNEKINKTEKVIKTK